MTHARKNREELYITFDLWFQRFGFLASVDFF